MSPEQNATSLERPAGDGHVPVVTMVTVTYGHADEIETTLRAALHQDVEGPCEVLVVDNASTDSTPEVIQNAIPDAQLIRLGANVGYAAGNNRAAEQARGRHLLLLNPDCRLDPGCAEQLSQFLDEHPEAGIAAALLRNPDGSPQRFARREITLSTVAWTLTSLGRRVDGKFLDGRAMDHRCYADLLDDPPTGPFEVHYPAAVAIMVRREDVGRRLFDPAYPLLFNDADLADRLRRRGLGSFVVPLATATHSYGTSLGRTESSALRAEFVASLVRFLRTRWPRRRWAVAWTLLAVDALATATAGRLLRRQDLRSEAAGTLGGLGLPTGAERLFPTAESR